MSVQMYVAFQRHARECEYDAQQCKEASISFFTGYLQATTEEHKPTIERMIKNVKERGFGSYGKLIDTYPELLPSSHR